MTNRLLTHHADGWRNADDSFVPKLSNWVKLGLGVVCNLYVQNDSNVTNIERIKTSFRAPGKLSQPWFGWSKFLPKTILQSSLRYARAVTLF